MFISKIFLTLSFYCTFMMVCVSNAELVTVRTDREEAVYEVSEIAVFEVSATVDIDCEYSLTYDGGMILNSGSFRVQQAKPVMIKGSLDKPGFLRITLKYLDPENGKDVHVIAAAGFDPSEISPAYKEAPEDFDDFWEERKAELRSIPMESVIKQIASPDPKVEFFDVKIRSLGMPVSGYYSRPVDAKVKTSPAILFLQGAGVCSATTGMGQVEFARLGFIVLEINAHGIPNGKDNLYYENLGYGEYSGYWKWGKESPYTSYFTGMCIRIVRALDFLKSQPEWDGEILITYGQSQGGFQALAGAGLDHDVNIAIAGVPAMCDHSGIISGWPRLVSLGCDAAHKKQIARASRYIDSVNFARLSKAYGLFTVGFIDATCRPTSIYAAYNSFQGDKEIINKPLMGHMFTQDDIHLIKEKILGRIRKIKDRCK